MMFKEGSRVIDKLFPEFGPATLKQHPDPNSASNFRNNLDKWIIEFDDKSKPTFWISKKSANSQIRLIDDQLIKDK